MGHIRYIFKCLYLESSGNDIFCSSLNIGWTNFEVTLEMYEECRVLNIFLGAMPTKSLKTNYKCGILILAAQLLSSLGKCPS